MQKNLAYYLGNILIVGSILCTALIYAPIMLPQKSTPLSDEVRRNGTSIEIPAIDATAEIVLDVDPFDKSKYLVALDRGVAHAQGTAKPGEDGTIFLFAHSSLPPWEMTRVNTPFLSLQKLEYGHSVLITNQGKTETYIVFDRKEVWPNEVDYLANSEENMLILQTCTPLGTSLKRLLIFAKRV